MSKPTTPKPGTCGACRFWAPWLRQQEFLGTCGGQNIGQCTSRGDTCTGYSDSKLTEALA